MSAFTLLRSASSIAAKISGLIVLAMAGLISADIAVRGLFNVTLFKGGVGELSGYALAIVTVWGSALTLLNRAHIRIDAALPLLSRPVAAGLDIFALTSFTIMSGILVWAGWTTFSRTFALNAHSMTPLAMPLAIPQGLWMAGLVFLFVTSTSLLAIALSLLMRGDFRAINRLAGTRTVAEEIEEAQTVSIAPPGKSDA